MQEQEIQAIREARAKKFQEMGVSPTFTHDQVIEASNASAAYSKGNASMRDRINKIKSGMLRTEMIHFNEAESNNPNEFKPIPELKPGQRQHQNQGQNNRTIPTPKLESFNDKHTHEAFDIESMFESGPSYSNRSDIVMGNAWNEKRQQAFQNYDQPIINENYLNKMPSIEDQMIYKRQNYDQSIQQTQYNDTQYSQQLVGPTQIRNLVENIANEIITQKVQKAILETTGLKKQSDNALTYKKVRNSKGEILSDHIMIENKIYKIQEVKKK